MGPNSVCPVCGNAILTPIRRKSLFGISNSPPEQMAVMAFRCQNGHFFLAHEEEAEDDPEAAA